MACSSNSKYMAEAVYDMLDEPDFDSASEESDSDSSITNDPIDNAQNSSFFVDPMHILTLEEPTLPEPTFSKTWTTDEATFKPRIKPQYTERPGPVFQYPEYFSAIDYFDLFWTLAFWQNFVTQTNLYAAQCLAADPSSHKGVWKPVDIEELKVFIGLAFGMGVLRLPVRSNYWRRSVRLFQTNFGLYMARDRFDQIWRYMHLSDNTAHQETHDKLQKVRWLSDFLNEKFRGLYTPDGNVTVDESMIKFKGRLGMKQYMPAKPTKWGIKVWSLAESQTGYLHRFAIYAGKNDLQPNVENRGLAHRIVSDITSGYQNTYIHVYMDNYYTSPALLKELYDKKICAAGTVRGNRKGLPTDLLQPGKLKQLKKHEFMLAQTDELAFCVWKDTKAVMVLSNFHSAQDIGTVNRRSGHQTQQAVEVPLMLADYQKHMGGVDLMDQMSGYYQLENRSKKWWRRVFFWSMIVSAHNAYILATKSHPVSSKSKWKRYRNFVEAISQGLLANHRPQRAIPIPILDVPPPAPPLPSPHTRAKLFDSNSRKSCHVCSGQKSIKRSSATYLGCLECKVPLHDRCFLAHVQMSRGL